MLKTRHRERVLFQACLEAKQPFVVDNTNPACEDRARYIPAAKEAGFSVTGYFFQSRIEEAISRNRKRPEAEFIPEAGVRATHSRLEMPTKAEGFDELFFVQIVKGTFVVEDWK